LQCLRPRTVLVSAGRENRFGHPSPAVLDRIARAGAAARRTDLEGTILIERRGDGWLARGRAP